MGKDGCLWMNSEAIAIIQVNYSSLRTKVLAVKEEGVGSGQNLSLF